jgi:light-dependent protochlorophyllide reductase
MADKTALITGGNRGLGLAAAQALAKQHDWHIILAGRDLEHTRQAAANINQQTGRAAAAALHLDLASLASVREFAAALPEAAAPPLRAVVANAGLSKDSLSHRSAEGFELTFAVNHLGHFLLVHLLLNQLRPPARIVVVSSNRHDPTTPGHRTPGPRYVNGYGLAYPDTDPVAGEEPQAAGARAYDTTKLCNLLFTYELARRLEKSGLSTPDRPITANAFNPGLVAGTGLARDSSPRTRFIWHRILPLMRFFIPGAHSAAESGAALARLVTDPLYGTVSGRYFDLLKEKRSSPESYDRQKAAELWQTSLSLADLRSGESPLVP